ncbi:Uncharacterised protein [uncultured archaeon]|nr:Uncharacterised protein [uncultured archaeon]
MEKLEKSLEKAELITGQEKKEQNLKGSYEGLVLLTEKVHYGGTSIKYWM